MRTLKLTLARLLPGYQDLWEAARVGNMDEIMNKLFRQEGFVASQKDLSHGIHAAAVHGREDVIDILIRHGANPSDDGMFQVGECP